MDRQWARVIVAGEFALWSLLEILILNLSSDEKQDREWALKHLGEFSLLLRKWTNEYPDKSKDTLEAEKVLLGS